MWDALKHCRMALRTIDRLYVWSAIIGLATAVILIEIGIVMQTRPHGG